MYSIMYRQVLLHAYIYGMSGIMADPLGYGVCVRACVCVVIMTMQCTSRTCVHVHFLMLWHAHVKYVHIIVRANAYIICTCQLLDIVRTYTSMYTHVFSILRMLYAYIHNCCDGHSTFACATICE